MSLQATRGGYLTGAADQHCDILQAAFKGEKTPRFQTRRVFALSHVFASLDEGALDKHAQVAAILRFFRSEEAAAQRYAERVAAL